MSKSILVATANLGEQNISLDIIQKWEPEKMSFISDTVFFKVDDTFFSMKKEDFCNIFTEKCAYIKY
jgi:hypothetical protein